MSFEPFPFPSLSLFLCRARWSYVSAGILLDRGRSLELFRSQYARESLMEENKTILKQKYDEAKAIGERVNQSRARIRTSTDTEKKKTICLFGGGCVFGCDAVLRISPSLSRLADVRATEELVEQVKRLRETEALRVAAAGGDSTNMPPSETELRQRAEMEQQKQMYVMVVVIMERKRQ
jgi:hypothetical protein